MTQMPQSSPVLRRARCTALALVMASAAVVAQGQSPTTAQPEGEATGTPLRVEIVLSRTDAKGTRLSRMPYVFSLAPTALRGFDCRLRMGAQVPIVAANGEVTYRDIGTNIDCMVRSTLPDGRYQLQIVISETSMVGEDMIEPSAAKKFGDLPIFRSYSSTNHVILRNGESARFTTAADRVTGETVVAEVTLTVLK